jgi:hypothetical protein
MKTELVSVPIQPETFKRLERHIKNRVDVKDFSMWVERSIDQWEWDKFGVYGDDVKEGEWYRRMNDLGGNEEL